jgi:hypothetical protein
MQGGQGPGRGVYVARRILAALVVLILLVLLVPWACQNFLGSGEGSGTSETADVDSSDDGGEEAAKDQEVDTDEEASTDAGVEGVDTSRDSDSGETGAEDDQDSDDAEVDEDGGASNIELDSLGFVPSFEAAGAVEQIPPAPGPDAGNLQPIAPAEPVLPVEPTVPVEPVFLAEPAFFEDPFLFQDPYLFEDPFYFEDPFLFEDEAFFGEPVALEEPLDAFEEPVVESVGPIAYTSAADVEVDRRGDGGRRGHDRIDVDRGDRDGRDRGPG